MDWLLLATWAALIYALFTLLRIRVNPWTVGAAALIGLCTIGVLVAVMDQAQPYSGRLTFAAPSVAVRPASNRWVSEVLVQPGQPVKAGDVLFRTDPTAFDLVIQQRRAALAEAEQLLAAVKAAQETGRDDAARNAFRVPVEATAAAVARARAELAIAEHDLSQSSVRAPQSGIVAAVAIRPGSAAKAESEQPAVIIVRDAPGDRELSARFRASAAQKVRVGNEAELVLDFSPGRVFRAKVTSVVAASAADRPAGHRRDAGRAVVKFELVDDVAAPAPAVGTTGAAAIYTEQAPSVAVVRRLLLRMRSWLAYICG